jgi:LmbE family N-acetylglucosaminyl deacetylase
MKRYKNVLVVSAHPDDMEIACSGTLHKLQQQGSDIFSIITVCPSEEINPNRNKNIVSHELNQSYNISKFKLTVLDTNLHTNGRPNLVCDNLTVTNLSKLFKSYDLLIIPNLEDSHQDHRTTHHLMLPFIKNVPEVWLMHSWPYDKLYKNKPNIFVNIDQNWSFKQQLLECYSSYLNSDCIEKIKLANQYYGMHLDCTLAEAFTLVHRYEN